MLAFAELYGKDEKEQTLIDMVNDQQEDIRVGYVRLIYQEYVRNNLKRKFSENLKSVLVRLHTI